MGSNFWLLNRHIRGKLEKRPREMFSVCKEHTPVLFRFYYVHEESRISLSYTTGTETELGDTWTTDPLLFLSSTFHESCTPTFVYDENRSCMKNGLSSYNFRFWKKGTLIDESLTGLWVPEPGEGRLSSYKYFWLGPSTSSISVLIQSITRHRTRPLDTLVLRFPRPSSLLTIYLYQSPFSWSPFVNNIGPHSKSTWSVTHRLGFRTDLLRSRYVSVS